MINFNKIKFTKIKNGFTVMLLSFVFLINTQITITGAIIRDDNFPVTGLSVLIEGTNNGTPSDLDGKYTIMVSEKGPTLKFR